MICWAIIALLFVALFGGCSSSDNGGTSPAQGGASFVLEWAVGRTMIPGGTLSVRIEISVGTILLKSRICNRPDGGGTVDEQFDQLPAGLVSYTVTAYSQANAEGAMVGTAAGDLTIEKDHVTPIALGLKAVSSIYNITLTPSATQLHPGDSTVIGALAKNSMGEIVVATFTWVSSDTTVATVDTQGKVYGLSPGTVNITATEAASGKTASVAITVAARNVIVSITPGSSIKIDIQETIKLTAKAVDDAGNTVVANFSWTTSSNSVASVDTYGTVTGISAGTAIITATDTNSNAAQSVTFTVNPPSLPSGTGKIVFYSDRTGNNELYVVNGNGTGLTQITTGTAQYTDPVFNRTGTQIACVVGSQGSRTISIMNADGSNMQPIPLSGGDNSDPAFSFDGRKIAYTSTISGFNNIYIYDMYTGTSSRITSTTTGGDYHPSFSPDGSLIVFASDRDGNSEIYLMNVNGTNQTRLTFETHWDGMPIFSPQGNKLAFVTNRVNGSAYQTFTMNLDGTGQTQVLQNVSYCTRTPSYSPDGTQFATASNPNNQFDIYIMNIDGSGYTLLTGGSSKEMHPSWAP